jgi:pilus assembly protein Flp/PilA
MMKLVANFAKDESGATAIEYGLLAALIAVALIATISTLTNSLKNTFGSVTKGLDNAAKIK